MQAICFIEADELKDYWILMQSQSDLRDLKPNDDDGFVLATGSRPGLESRLNSKNKGLPNREPCEQTGIRVRSTLSRNALDTVRRRPTRVMRATIMRTSFQSLSAEKICINRALPCCFAMAQNVPKRSTFGVMH